MEDTQILKQIQELVAEERTLREHAASGDAGPDIHARLESLEIDLDQCWDLLRQRRALRESGGEPDAAKVRTESTVERYIQ